MKDGNEMGTAEEDTPEILIVVPCLNEAAHIGGLLGQFTPATERIGAKIVVADGGSTDGTQRIVEEKAAQDARVVLLANPKRIQSAAVNLAVERHGEGCDYLIRIDAHGAYPDDYCDRLVEEAVRTGADSVVVAMATKGFGFFQRAVAAAQNSRLGNGGSPHRHGASDGAWTDHGHHALMRVAAFRSVGGYDETFTHNEDAELDYRLRQAGFRIWLTGKTIMTYYPRASVSGLFRQYVGYGRGRARNMLKHGMVPKVRQMLPLMVFPVVAGTSLAFLHWSAIVPASLWALICLGYGALMAIAQRNPDGMLAGFSAMVMHLAWSLGFWQQLLSSRKPERAGR
ncbi:glycosyltransferase family 2 protein [Mesorhizobium sp. L-8-3]|uniref:glycosyltransferase family 2 protein n=1 Tax=Mesorhizobium sp. L-8-3 TaxID=2744522 RepID=UPI00193725DF|nr:glycosyltransferase family 2 protein [Mesorhizobium sp. L-8-3]BCH23915.1 succinoglycan biosynthesis protein exoa [Mesorhizobium sp. L-8-3]